jgi:hypothetical protein
MSDALVGAIIGGILSLTGSFGALFVRDWLQQRGHIPWKVGDCAVKIFRLPDPNSTEPNSTEEMSTFSTLRSLQDEDLNDVTELHLTAVVRLHNKKDVNVGLMEMHIALLQGSEQILKCTPHARIRYLGPQEEQKQEPFQAATLLAQQVVIIYLKTVFTNKGAIEQVADCDRARLSAGLSNGDVKEQELIGPRSR